MKGNVLRSRSARCIVGTVGLVAALGMGSSITAASAAPSARSAVRAQAAPPAVGTHYAIGVPACAPPPTGDAGCTAIRREVVPKGTDGAQPFVVASGGGLTVGPAGGYTPADLASAYGVNPAGGSGQTVAVVDAFNDPSALADLDTFDKNYGLPAETSSTFEVVGQDGSAILPANDTTGWSVEESLDVDTVRGMCNGCRIILVEVDDENLPDLATGEDTAVTLGATEISNSYGFDEYDFDPTAADAAAFNHLGVVITASTGDDGWDSYDELGAQGKVDSPSFPSSLPSVVAVGGTTLTLTRSGARRSETVWNDDGIYANAALSANGPLGATGGGCSTLYSAPTWQQGVAGYSNTGCGTERLAGDVSADADYLTGLDLYDSYDDFPGDNNANDGTGWQTVGGTSLSSPLIAALWALAGGAHGLQYPAESLYGHLGSASLYDVTVGGNGLCEGLGSCEDQPALNAGPAGFIDCSQDASGAAIGDGACVAGPGYDGPSGVGTPDGLGAFVPATPTAHIAAPATLTAKKSAKFSGRTSTDPYPGGSISSYSWSWGDGSSTSSGGSVSHTFRKAGTFKVALTVTDALGETGHTTVRVKVAK
jgi:PKD domain